MTNTTTGTKGLQCKGCGADLSHNLFNYKSKRGEPCCSGPCADRLNKRRTEVSR